MEFKNFPIENPAVLEAVKKFHETVTKNDCFAMTTISNLENQPYGSQSNFESGLISEESYAWFMAVSIFLKAKELNVDPDWLMGKINGYVYVIDCETEGRRK